MNQVPPFNLHEELKPPVVSITSQKAPLLIKMHQKVQFDFPTQKKLQKEATKPNKISFNVVDITSFSVCTEKQPKALMAFVQGKTVEFVFPFLLLFRCKSLFLSQ